MRFDLGEYNSLLATPPPPSARPEPSSAPSAASKGPNLGGTMGLGASSCKGGLLQRCALEDSESPSLEKKKGKKDDKKSKKKDKKRKCDDSSDSPAKPLFGGHEDDDDDKDDAAEQAKPKKKGRKRVRGTSGQRPRLPKTKSTSLGSSEERSMKMNK